MEGISSDVFSAMQTGRPYKTYIKTILGKVFVNLLNPFDLSKEGKILVGNPKEPSEDCIVQTWSEMDDAYFKRKNKRHFEDGTIIEQKQVESAEQKRSPNALTNEEIDEILASSTRFLKMQKLVNDLTSLPPLFRLLERAKELEKSERIISFLQSKISELQAKEYSFPETTKE